MAEGMIRAHVAVMKEAVVAELVDGAPRHKREEIRSLVIAGFALFEQVLVDLHRIANAAERFGPPEQLQYRAEGHIK